MNRPRNLPPKLEKALAQPSTQRQSWSSGFATILVATFLWAAFCDPVAAIPLSVGGAIATILGASLGGLAGAAVLYAPAALSGLRTRQPLMVIASSSFGAIGVTLIPGLLLGVVQILWFAVAIHYAVDWNLRGLVGVGLISETSIRAAEWGWSIPRSPVYAATATLWGIAAALVATRFIRWIAALMFVFPIFCVLALLGTALNTLLGPRIGGAPALSASNPTFEGGWLAVGASFQFVFGFITIVATQSFNWGATLRSSRDVALAGMTGMVIAPSLITAIVTFCIVGSNPGTTPVDPSVSRNFSELSDLTLGGVIEGSVGGIAGGLSLIAFGLASMAFGVYSAYAFSNRFETIRRRPRRWAWGVIGAIASLPIMVTGLASNVPLIVDLTAGLLAPMLGVMAAGFLRSKGDWAGPDGDVRRLGFLCWALGVPAGLLPVLGRLVPWFEPCRWWPSALLGFAISFVADYLISAFTNKGSS